MRSERRFGKPRTQRNARIRRRVLEHEEGEVKIRTSLDRGDRTMEGESTATVAIMAAIIYAIRMGGQGPTQKSFDKIAQEAWDLHRAVAGGGEPRSKAGF